jgi:hypothetical protein
MSRWPTDWIGQTSKPERRKTKKEDFRMKRSASVAALFLAGHIGVTSALAGIADSPLPVLEAGKTTYHVYTVPGAMDDTRGTYFSCTSLEKTATIRVGVEVFSGGGFPANDAVATSVLVGPGGTTRLGTRPAVGFFIASDVGGPISDLASARILATSTKLACTAFIADPNTSPPSMVQLTIIKKTKQKGD